MATKQTKIIEGTVQDKVLKAEIDGGENQAKLIPMDYLSLVLILAPFFGDPDAKQIANF